MRLQAHNFFYLFPLIFCLQYLTGCSSGSDSVSGCPLGSGPNVTISGKITFDLVPHDNGGGLLYANTAPTPAKAVIVELACSTNAVAVSTVTDSVGYYTMQIPAGTMNVFVRAKAEMKQTGSPSWHFSVVDNTQRQALYSMSGAIFTSSTDSVRDLHAASGWTGTSYGEPRVAAPFAILNSVQMAAQKILSVSPATIFPPLKLNWSPNNVTVEGDAALGQITGSLYNGADIFILGEEDNDTDEYDEHVIIHEFGHYIEHNFSRADSVGGRHQLGDKLDMRVAFGEGFANAFSAIVTDNSVYMDSSGPGQTSPWSFDIDDNNYCTRFGWTPGWFSECTVQAILYDLYDITDDSVDTLSLGFEPIYSVLLNEQKNTTALTSIFSFIHALKNKYSSSVLTIDAINLLVSSAVSSISIVSDEFGSAEIHKPGNNSNVLPVYTDVFANGATKTVCVIDDFKEIVNAKDYNENKLSSYRFLKLTVPTTNVYSIVVNKVNTPIDGPGNDPDIVLYQGVNGIVNWSLGTVINTERLTTVLGAGLTYIIQINDKGVTSSQNFGRDADTCFSVAVSN